MKRFLSRLLPKSMRSDAVTIPVIRLHGTIMSGGGQFRPNLSLASTAELLEKAFAFKDAYRMLTQRISVFMALPIASLDKLALQTKLHEIGRIGDQPAESAA